MKKLTKILVVALMLSLLVCAFVFTTGAAEENTSAPFEIKGVSYNTWAEAYAAAKDGDTIAMTNNYTFLDTDYTSGITYYSFNLTTEKAGNAQVASGTFTKTTTEAIFVDKNITLNLGGYTLTSEKVDGEGIVFYVNDTVSPYDDRTFTIEGSGKISSAVPVLVVSRGNAVIDGANNGMTIEYTGTKLISQIHVGNMNNNPINSSGANIGSSSARAQLTVSGKVNFHSTENVIIFDSAGAEYPVYSGANWNMNVNWYSAIAVNPHHTLNIDKADISVTSDGSARTLVTWDPIVSYYTNRTKINVTNSEIKQNLDAPILAAGANNGNGYLRRAVITIDNSKLTAGTTNELGIIQAGRTSSARGSAEIIATNSEFIQTSSKGAILHTGSGSPFGTTGYGLQTAASFTNCYLSVGSSGNFAQYAITAIYDDCYFVIPSNGFYGAIPWISKSDANYTTASGSIPSGKLGQMEYLDDERFGGYGILIKDGCAFSKQRTDYDYSTQGGAPGVQPTANNKGNVTFEAGTSQISGIAMANNSFVSSYYITKSSVAPYKSYSITDMQSTSLTVNEDGYVEQTSQLSLRASSGTVNLVHNSTPGGRHGRYSVYLDEKSGNKFISHRHYLATANGPYIDAYYTLTGVTTNDKDSSGNYIANSAIAKVESASIAADNYYSLDWDMMTPTGKYDTGYVFTPFVYSYTGAYQSTNANTLQHSKATGANSLRLTTDSNGNSYFTHDNSAGAESTATIDTTPGVWHHFTYIIEINHTDISASKAYLYYDGELFGSFKQVFNSTWMEEINKANVGASHVNIRSIRINLPNSNTSNTGANKESTTGGEAAFDNIALTRFDTSFSGTADDVSTNIFNQLYKIPKSVVIKPAITVDGEGFATQSLGMETVQYNSVITLNSNYRGTFVPTAPCVVETNDYDFEYETTGTGLIAEEHGDTITFRWLRESDKIFEVDGVPYTSWADAYSAVSDGGTIKLMYNYSFTEDDLTSEQTYYFMSDYISATDSSTGVAYESGETKVNTILLNKSITIDLNGNTLSSNGVAGVLFYVKNANYKLTFTGEGKISTDIPVVQLTMGAVELNGTGEGLTLEYTGTKVDRQIKLGFEKYNDGQDLITLDIKGKVNFNTTNVCTDATSNSYGADTTERAYAAIGVNKRTVVNFNDAVVTNNANDGATPRAVLTQIPISIWGNEYTSDVNIEGTSITNNASSAIFTAHSNNSKWGCRIIFNVENSTITSTAAGWEKSIFKLGLASSKQSTAEIIIDNSVLTTSGGIVYSGWRNSSYTMADPVFVTVKNGSSLITTGYVPIFGYAVNARVESGCYLEYKDRLSIATIPWVSIEDANYTSYVTANNGIENSLGYANSQAGAVGLSTMKAVYDEFGGFGVLLEEGVIVNKSFTPDGTKGLIMNEPYFCLSIPENSVFDKQTVTVNGKTMTAYVLADVAFVYEVIKSENMQGISGEFPIEYYDSLVDPNIGSLGLVISSSRTEKDEGGNNITVKYPRTGAYYINRADDGKNIYLSHIPYMSENTVVDQPYIYINFGASYDTSTGVYANGDGISTVSYYSMDFDLATPTGIFEEFEIQPVIRVRDNAGKHINYSINSLVIKTDDDGNAYWYQSGAQTSNGVAGDVSPSFAVEAGEWHHYTYVIAINHNNGYSAYDTYIYMDGVLIAKFGDVKTTVPALMEQGGLTNADTIALDQVRLGFQTTKTTSNYNAQVSIDNMTVASFGTTFTANCDTAEETINYISTLVYNEKYEMPYGFTKASVDGVNFDNLDDALAALKENGTLKLFVDFPTTYIPTFAHTVDANGRHFDYYSEIYVCDIEGTVHVFRIAEEDDKYTVTWYNPDGSILTQTEHKHGTTVGEIPEYDQTVNGENGWLKFSYAGWSKVRDGEVTDDFKILKETSYYPAVANATPYLVDAMFNLTLYGNIQLNILIPDSDIPQGVNFIGVYSDLASAEAGTGALNSIETGIPAKGRTYSQYIAGEVGATELSNIVNVYVKFTYGQITLYQKINMSAYSYAKNVLSRGEGTTGSTVVADLVRYSNELTKASNKSDTGNAELEELLANYNYTSDISSVTFPESDADYSNLTQYVDFITFNMSASEPTYYIDIKDGALVKSVSLSMNGWVPNETDNYNFGYLSYNIDESKTTKNNGYITVCESESIPIYNLDQQVTITLTVELDTGSTTTVSGTYDLNAYYNGIKAGNGFTETDIERYKAFLVALRAYASTTAEYRYGGEKLELPVRVVTYSEFGAVGDGKTDDFDAIKAAHDYANSLAYEGKDLTSKAKVIVKATYGATYYIGKDNGTYSTTPTSVIIMTDTDWTGANFIIDDSVLTAEVVNDYVLGSSKEKTGYSYSELTDDQKRQYNQFFTPLFVVADNDTSDTSTSPYSDAQSFTRTVAGGSSINGGKAPTSITRDATNIGFAPGYAALIKIRNNNHKQYVRHGGNANIGVYQNDVILVDAEGNIDPSTPPQYDYTNIYYLKIWNVEVEPITIKGGTFETKYNSIDSYSYLERGIQVIRHNTTLEGISHTVDESTYSNTKNASGNYTGASPMNFFFGNFFTNNVTFKDIVVHGTRKFYSGTVLRGSYELGLGSTIGTKFINVDQDNFFYVEDGEGDVESLSVMGTNYLKNFYMDGCLLATFDSHTGLHNIVINNSEFEHVNLVGTGDAYINNTTIHTGATGTAVILRDDYGSSWEGDVHFKNLTLVVNDHKYVSLFRFGFYNYNTGLYYQNEYNNDTNNSESYYAQDTVKDGDDSHYYSAYLPQNITVDGLTIMAGGKVTNAANGKGTCDYGHEADSFDNIKFAILSGVSYGSNDTRGDNYAPHVFSQRTSSLDISTYGSSGKVGGTNLGLFWTGGTTVTIKHPLKPTETITFKNCDYSSFSMIEYFYDGKSYDLTFYNPTITKN